METMAIETASCVIAGQARSSKLAQRLATRSKFIAELMESHGRAAKAVVDSLKASGLEVPYSDAKDIRDIAGMKQIVPEEKLQAGDLVVITPHDDDFAMVGRHGDAFIVTNDGKAARDHIGCVPNLFLFHDVRVYRAS